MRYLVALIAVSLFGCGTALFGSNVNQKIDSYAKSLADAYCLQPLSVRELDSRPRIKQAVRPHKFEGKLICVGDPEYGLSDSGE